MSTRQSAEVVATTPVQVHRFVHFLFLVKIKINLHKNEIDDENSHITVTSHCFGLVEIGVNHLWLNREFWDSPHKNPLGSQKYQF